MMINVESIWTDIRKIRDTAPLIHNITNYVVMNTTANALLALGASPVMAHAGEEVEDMVGISRALVINIGTLSEHWITAMLKAAKRAKKMRIPIVLDPVGVGATDYRTRTGVKIISEFSPEIIRGNASEIISLVDKRGQTKGVDSSDSSQSALEAAARLAEDHRSTVCISGETDYIIYGNSTAVVKNGHPMMSKVTGMGCTASALCGAFAAVNPNYGEAAAHAMAIMGIVGEIAALKAEGPSSFQNLFIDKLYNLAESDIAKYLIAEV